jgi:hypothetical protein
MRLVITILILIMVPMFSACDRATPQESAVIEIPTYGEEVEYLFSFELGVNDSLRLVIDAAEQDGSFGIIAATVERSEERFDVYIEGIKWLGCTADLPSSCPDVIIGAYLNGKYGDGNYTLAFHQNDKHEVYQITILRPSIDILTSPTVHAFVAPAARSFDVTRNLFGVDHITTQPTQTLVIQ